MLSDSVLNKFAVILLPLLRHSRFRDSFWQRGIKKKRRKNGDFNEGADGNTVFIGYCDYHLVTRVSDIVTIFPIPKANLSTVALLLLRDYLLEYLLDIATILPSSRGSHNIR